jgi:twitching motility protein PilT
MIRLQHLLKAVVEQGATDLHITAHAPPVMRINGNIVRVKYPPLGDDDTKTVIFEILNQTQQAKLEEKKELDLAFEIKGLARFRANIFRQQGAYSAAFRLIPSVVPTVEQLGLPNVIVDMTKFDNGLILVTGPTGSGKSTTLAAMIDRLNTANLGHIVTIEDPIEYIHQHKNCIVNQREVGSDTWTIASAVKSLLRQDPDYCLVGELRDPETVEEAVRISETGHLTFGTLHTNSAAQTITRLVNMFPPEQQDRLRSGLSMVLQGIVSQRLLPGRDGKLVLALEILVVTPAVRNLIRENKIAQLTSIMQSGQNITGMITMNQSLEHLVKIKKIDLQTAFSASPDIDELEKMIAKSGVR